MLSYRPTVRAPHAMVASAHPLATQAGLDVLRAGGSAVDAGLATNAVLNVTQPAMCGFGGDAFFLYFEAATGQVHAYNATGRSPATATLAALHAAGHATMPARGPLAATVPGVADGWEQLHRRFGRRPWSELFGTAIGYARDGHPVSDQLAGWLAASAELLQRWPASAAAMLPAGHPPRPGERLRQPDLAATLEQLAAEGAAALYRGALGQELGRAVLAAGGLLSPDDLAAHRGEWTVPVGCAWHGLEVLVHGPNSQGWTLPLMLALTADRDPSELAPGTAAAIHLGVEAKRLAFADRDAYNTDPAEMTVDVRRLLAPEHVQRRRASLCSDQAMPDPAPSSLERDTTYFAVVDTAGNALSVIQSLFHGFGTGFVAGATGLFLQNRGHYFSLDPQHPNRLAPRKRTAHTLTSALVLRNGQPVLVPGTMGGDRQPQILYQLISAILDHGYTPQAAIELPRWAHEDGELLLEDRVAPAVADELARRGHRIRRLEPWAASCGHAQVIAVTADGLAGGADPRGDGQAAGF